MARYQRAGFAAGLLLVTGGLTLTLTGSSLFHPDSQPGGYVSPSVITHEGHAGLVAPTGQPATKAPARTRSTGPTATPTSTHSGRQRKGEPSAKTQQPSAPSTQRATSTSTAASLADRKTSSPSRPNPRAPQGAPSHVTVVSAHGVEQVDTSLRPAYLDKQDYLIPAPGAAGWYAEAGWPKPGYPGTSILVGHISWSHQPDVFWNLPRVRIGDTVVVTYTSGQKVRFTVTRSSPERKTSVPHDTSIWDAGNPRPLLRLITCDPSTTFVNHHYLGNWVVWAVPA
jgi:hypothetical protein